MSKVQGDVLHWLLATARKLERIASQLYAERAVGRIIHLDELVPRSTLLRADAAEFVPRQVACAGVHPIELQPTSSPDAVTSPECRVSHVTTPNVAIQEKPRFELLPSVGTWIALPNPQKFLVHPKPPGMSDLCQAAQDENYVEMARLMTLNVALRKDLRVVYPAIIQDLDSKIEDIGNVI